MTDPNALTGQVELFYSYSHVDEELRDELQKHLSLLQREGVIHQWHDRQIGAGSEWAGQIDGRLDAAQIILLLVSADFLASDYCVDIEMARALERHDSGQARVIPVILRDCDWSGALFGKLQALPKNAEPITSWSNRDEAFTDVAKGIRQAVEEISGDAPADRPSAADRGLQSGSARIVAKGLISYDAQDAGYFLDLLPPPIDRGLPRCVRMWKDRVEETDADKTFAVGLLFGPSGCGKSSLVKAGLIPQLDDSVVPVYVEAAPDETEVRLLKGLRKALPALPGDLSLPETLSAIVEQAELLDGRKMLLVLDQFEQWLHQHRSAPETELVEALQACDGGRLQCLLMIRPEFLPAVYRLFEALDINLRTDRNTAMVDLFDRLHARNVLAEFGRSYGRLPSGPSQRSVEQNRFLDEAVAGLADQDGRIVAVRLVLLAEMVKGKPWTSETLRDVGGAKGVGRAFLDENFSRPTSPYRRHEKAAMAVLQALLPETGHEIRGHMRSEQELREKTKYTAEEFSRLIVILGGQLRLVTPTEPEEAAGDGETEAAEGQKFYQLTHDYLVPSARSWLTRRLQSTWRGRTQLKLEERTAQWAGRQERRFLPGPVEFVTILLGVPWRSHQTDQRAMMFAAGRWYASIATLVVFLLCVGGYVWRDFHGRSTAPGLVADLLRSRDADDFRQQVRDKLRPYRGWVLDELERTVSQQPSADYEQFTEGSRVKLGKERADAAIAMYGLGAPDRASSVFQLDGAAGDPEALTQFVHRAKERGVQKEPGARARQLFDQLKKTEDPSARYGLLLALGEFKYEELPRDEREAWVEFLGRIYAEHPNSSVHSACGWLLRRWGPTEQVDKVDKTPREYSPDREWFVVKVGEGNQADFFTFIVFNQDGEGRFEMGSPESEGDRGSDETLHTVRLTRAFAVCEREVTQAQFTRYRQQSLENKDQAEHPVSEVSWYDAVRYCRWLTDRAQASQEQCYPDPQELDAQKFERDELDRHDPKAPKNWPCNLDKDGFRLPTEAEWEYACRAGTRTRFSFGSDDDWLGRYAWYGKDLFDGAATLTREQRPNPRGLFDVHGNVWEWCQDWYSLEYYSKSRESNPPGPEDGAFRVNRGGSWYFPAGYCRSAFRGRIVPVFRFDFLGFRVARSLSGK